MGSAGRHDHRALRLVLAGPVAAWLVLSGLLSPLLAPLARAIARLRLAVRLKAWAAGLPPAAALLCLAVPVLLIEPMKLGALALVAGGHPLDGALLLIVLHGASFLVTERLFGVLEPALMEMGWFARGWTQVRRVRERILDLVRGMAPVVVARSWALRLRKAFRGGP